ncbi:MULTISPECIES: hypothetical protein [Nocardia]|uniref:hypothetical protein n=1 Tax=Nocardia TaxID=1817 RepID=UPI000D697ED8|nr:MULTISPECIES: hypothetical protein [Nocardia]
MSGDPVEESGQALRQGAVQAFQMAHTTAALMRGRGGESRSKSEHDQRVELAAAREQRSIVEHNVRVGTAIGKAGDDHTIAKARVEEIRARIDHSQQAHELGQDETKARMSRAESDLRRRNRMGRQEYRHNEILHAAKVDAYAGRETRAGEVHALEVEYKQLLIDIRRRAAGFSDTLTSSGSVGDAAASTAAFAAANASEGLSDEHAADAAAYERRFHTDTGRDYRDIVDATLEDPDPGTNSTTPTPGAELDLAVIDVEIIDLSGEEVVGSGAEEVEPEYRVSLDAVRELTEELTLDTYLTHEFSGSVADPGSDPDAVDVLAEAVAAAVVPGENPMAVDLADEVAVDTVDVAADAGLDL